MDPAIQGALALFHGARGERARVLETLFRHEREIDEGDARHVLGSVGIDDLRAVGLLRATANGFAGQVRLDGFRGNLLASDRLGFRRHADFVMGPGPSSELLAGAMLPIERGRALDLGCGPGTLALWLAGATVHVVGLDINERALAFAAFNRDFNGVRGTTFVRGDFLTASPDPELDGQFQLAFANPPFVLAPASELRYRDRPLPGDDTTRTAVERVARALAAGGRGYVVGTWLDAGGGSWDARPRSWLRALGLPAAIARVSTVSVTDYAVRWNRDLEEPARSTAIESWRRHLEAEGAARITTGIVAVARPRRSTWLRGRTIVSIDRGRPAWRTIEEALAA